MLRQNECRSLVTIVLKRQKGQKKTKNKKEAWRKIDNLTKKTAEDVTAHWLETCRWAWGVRWQDLGGESKDIRWVDGEGWRWGGGVNSVQTGIILAERTPTQKVPTSLHWIFICIKSLIYIHAVSALGFSITHSLSPSIPPCPSSLSLFILLHLPSFQSAFHVTPLGGVQREGWWLLSPASLLRFCCSCWAVIKRAKRRSFHTNYNIIMEHSVKATVKMKVKQSFV